MERVKAVRLHIRITKTMRNHPPLECLFRRSMVDLLTLEGKCLRRRAKPAHRHLPAILNDEMKKEEEHFWDGLRNAMVSLSGGKGSSRANKSSREKENRQGDNEGQSFDSFCITQIGAITLARWHGRALPPSDTWTPHPSVVVQPTFTILLLDPNNIEALYCLLPFTHIEQIGQVSKLTLTQAAVSHATSQGWDHDQIVTRLRELTAKELPQNMVHTLRTWS